MGQFVVRLARILENRAIDQHTARSNSSIPKYVMDTGQQLQYFSPDTMTTPGPPGMKGQLYIPVQLRGGEQSEATAATAAAARITNSRSVVCFICVTVSRFMYEQ